jgi:hypothetical protein
MILLINVEINNQNKKNKIPIKLKSSNSNSNKNNIITNKNTSNSLHINEIKIFNDIKINSKKINEENNDIINEIDNIKIDESSDSFNNDFEENIDFDINLYKFENFLNINRLDNYSNEKDFKTFEKDDSIKNLFVIGKNESVGLHRPIEDDISAFIGKNKFKNSKKLYSENNTTN